MEVSSLWAALNFIGLSLIIGTEISAIPLPGAPERFANVSDDLTFGDLNNTGLTGNIEEQGNYVEGDMIVVPSVRSGTTDSRKRWPRSIIPYDIDPKFDATETTAIKKGIQDIMTNTCIKFVPRTDEKDYVFIERGEMNTGCSSYVGRVGGKQKVNLEAPGCVKAGTVSHELIHALGFRHEHSRTDRDDFITVQWDNIKEGLAYAFNKYSSTVVNSFGVPYDYGSIMHYSEYAFTKKSGVATIVPKQPSVTIGQRKGLSAYDAQKIRNMYNCPNPQ